MLNSIATFLSFQIGWFADVVGASWGHPWIGPFAASIFIGIHGIARILSCSCDLAYTLVAFIGAVVDSGLGLLGVLQFHDALGPG